MVGSTFGDVVILPGVVRLAPLVSGLRTRIMPGVVLRLSSKQSALRFELLTHVHPPCPPRLISADVEVHAYARGILVLPDFLRAQQLISSARLRTRPAHPSPARMDKEEIPFTRRGKACQSPRTGMTRRRRR